MVEFCGSSTPSEIPKTTISKSVKSASSVSVGCFLSNDARVSVHDLSGRQTGKLKTLVSCIILYKPNEEKQNFWWITVLFKKKTVIRIIPKYCSWHLSHRRRFYKKNALSHEFQKKVKLAYLQKRWIQGIESQRQTSRKLDANVRNTQPPTRFHPDWNMTRAILFGSPFLGGSKYSESMFFVPLQQSLQIRCENSSFRNPKPSTLLFLKDYTPNDSHRGSQRDWKSPLDVPQKTTGTQRLWAKDASVPRAKLGMSTDLMCPPKKKRS